MQGQNSVYKGQHALKLHGSKDFAELYTIMLTSCELKLSCCVYMCIASNRDNISNDLVHVVRTFLMWNHCMETCSG